MRVIDSAHNPEENETYRRMRCPICAHVLYTVEYEVIVTKRFTEDWNAFHRNYLNYKERKNV